MHAGSPRISPKPSTRSAAHATSILSLTLVEGSLCYPFSHLLPQKVRINYSLGTRSLVSLVREEEGTAEIPFSSHSNPFSYRKERATKPPTLLSPDSGSCKPSGWKSPGS